MVLQFCYNCLRGELVGCFTSSWFSGETGLGCIGLVYVLELREAAKGKQDLPVTPEL